MFRRITAFFLSFLLLFISCAFADQFDEELDIEEIIDLSEEENTSVQQDSNGNPIITITCTGDLTIGGDNFHKKGKKFYSELTKNGENINFTMANVRDIFKNDTMTLVNFEGTFTNSKKVPTNKQGNDFLFNIDPKYVNVLTDNSIEAVSLAKRSEAVLLYIGLDEISESEGLDRSTLALPKCQTDVLKAVSEVNPNVIVVMSAGSSVEMPWLDQCKGLVHGYLCGQAGASAVLRVILGEVNPSGKLSESYPLKYEDCSSAPYFPAKERSVEYREGLFVGYRYYCTAKMPVLFPFGFGLSYTTFSYSDLKVTDKKAVFTLTNTGKVDGAEVAQLYVHAKNPSVYRPYKELKGFAKVFLKAGESREVTIELDDKAFRYWNSVSNRFEVDGGEYEIQIAASSADVRLAGSVTVKGTDAPKCEDLSKLPSYVKGDIKAVSDTEFRELLGHEIPDGKWSGTIQANDAIAQLYYAKSLKARLVWKIMTGMLNKSIEKGEPDLNITFIYNMPIRAIGKMAGGMVSQEMCDGILDIINGHGISFCKGLGKLISGFVKQQGVAKQQKALE